MELEITDTTASATSAEVAIEEEVEQVEEESLVEGNQPPAEIVVDVEEEVLPEDEEIVFSEAVQEELSITEEQTSIEIVELEPVVEIVDEVAANG